MKSSRTWLAAIALCMGVNVGGHCIASEEKCGRGFVEHTGIFPLIYSIATSNDGKYIAAFGGLFPDSIRLWQTDSGATVKLAQPPDGAYNVQFTKDDRQLIAATRDGSIVEWTIPDGNMTVIQTAEAKHPAIAAVLDDGKAVALAYPSGLVAVENSSDAALLNTLDVGSKKIYGLTASQNASTLLITDYNRHGLIFDTTGNKELGTIDARVYAVGVAPDGSEVGYTEGNVRGTQVNVWHRQSGMTTAVTTLTDLPFNTNNHIEFSHDGRKLLLWDGADGCDRITILDLQNKNGIQQSRIMIEELGDGGDIVSAAFMPDDETLAIGTIDGKIALFDTKTNVLRVIDKGQGI